MWFRGYPRFVSPRMFALSVWQPSPWLDIAICSLFIKVPQDSHKHNIESMISPSGSRNLNGFQDRDRGNKDAVK